MAEVLYHDILSIILSWMSLQDRISFGLTNKSLFKTATTIKSSKDHFKFCLSKIRHQRSCIESPFFYHIGSMYFKKCNIIKTYYATDTIQEDVVDHQWFPFITEILQHKSGLPNLNKVSFKYNVLDDRQIKIIMSLITNIPSLTDLDFEGNYMRVEGCRAISKCLKDHTYIQTLCLKNNMIRNQGMRELFDGGGMKNITSLNLQNAWIQEDGIQAMSDALIKYKHNILSFSIESNHIRHAPCMNKIIQNCPFLHTLNICKNPFSPETLCTILEALLNAKSIRTLILGDNDFDTKSVHPLCRLIRESCIKTLPIEDIIWPSEHMKVVISDAIISNSTITSHL